MTALLVVAAAGFFLFRLLGGAPALRVARKNVNQQNEAKIAELSDYALKLRAGNKYVGAEKVYLQILKIDHKHAPTYSRLGTLYVAMKNYDDAIECFQIAAQLSPSGATYYNLGLGYYENRNYLKAVAAFEKSIMFEPSVQRHVGLAKTFQRIGDHGRVVGALEQALLLDQNPKVMWMLAEAYQAAGMINRAAEVYKRISELNKNDDRARQALSRLQARSGDLEKTAA